MKRLFVLAGEASGDLYAGAFVRALKARVPDLEVRGWGGDELAAAGATVTRHFRELNFMGFAEVVRHLPTILRNLREARREVLARDKSTGYPTQVLITGQDQLGRELRAEGRCINKLGVPLNPNMLSINCLTEWTINGVTAFGEDHENWTPAAARNFFRRELGFRSP